MDAIDRDIIHHLREDGRLANTELADRVGLSPSPCLRRVRRLENEGIITGYHAAIDPRALGRGLEVIIHVDMAVKTEAVAQAFEDALAAREEVVELLKMFGSPDYLLRIAVENLQKAERFISGTLNNLDGVGSTHSQITMNRIVGT